MNVGGVGYIDTYVKFTSVYGIPYVTLVDKEYNGSITPSEEFVKLPSKLETELARIGFDVADHISPNFAYELVFSGMQKWYAKVRENIHLSDIGKVFDNALKKAGVVDPQKQIWKSC